MCITAHIGDLDLLLRLLSSGAIRCFYNISLPNGYGMLWLSLELYNRIEPMNGDI